MAMQGSRKNVYFLTVEIESFIHSVGVHKPAARQSLPPFLLTGFARPVMRNDPAHAFRMARMPRLAAYGSLEKRIPSFLSL